MKIYVNRIENRIAFKIKSEYYLELLTPEIMKLLGTTKKKKLKIKMVEMYQILKLLKEY